MPAALHFLWRNFLNLLLENPLVSEWIANSGTSMPEEFIARWLDYERFSSTGTGYNSIDIFYHQRKFHGCTTKSLRRFVKSRIFISQHNHGAVNQKFCMSNLARFWVD
jgi:hypothetical protein